MRGTISILHSNIESMARYFQRAMATGNVDKYTQNNWQMEQKYRKTSWSNSLKTFQSMESLFCVCLGRKVERKYISYIQKCSDSMHFSHVSMEYEHMAHAQRAQKRTL